MKKAFNKSLATALSLLFCYSHVQAFPQEEFAPVFDPSEAHETEIGFSEGNLTQSTARKRAQQVSQVKYDLELTLPQNQEQFRGELKLAFFFKPNGQPLRIDFIDGQIKGISLNGQVFKDYNYNKQYILIPERELKPGFNTVDISYQHDYSKNGAGLYRFIDPKDHKTYLYSNFEPFNANLMLPCFDQPDIKATFKLKVQAPTAWQVISTTRETSITADGQWRSWDFPNTQPMSTYVFSLIAGPYHKWEDNSGKIPLRLFARQSLAKYVDHQQWFKITQQGFKFFNDYFNYPYPFGKYDQILAPDFNAGAMENIGAVTFSEYVVGKGKLSAVQYTYWVNTILHEMAHMWFGNLVTMRWWNDLWLNESFASYMSYLAANALGYEDSWLYFYFDKISAYNLDGSVNTHPILADVPDIETAENQFDAITYNKGGAVLKQLDHYLGKDKLREGIRSYMRQFAYKNTELKDFFAALSQASGKNLQPFIEQWLTTTGFNTVELPFHCEKDKLQSLTITQNFIPFREHHAQLGLYYKDHDSLQLGKLVPISYNQGNTVVNFKDTACPDFVYPNEQDQDYLRYEYDPEAIELLLSKNISQIKNPLARAMLWQGLWEQDQAGDLSLPRYLETLLKQLPMEEHPALISRLLTLAGRSVDYLPQHSAVTKAYQTRYSQSLQQLVWQKLNESKPGSIQQLTWFDSFTYVARDPAMLTHLADFLSGAKQLPELTIDQSRRWNIILTLNSHAYPKAMELLKAEKQRDDSHEGHNMALAAEVSQPNLEVKKAWFNKLLTDDSLSFNDQRTIMRNLFPSSQAELLETFSSSFYANLLKLKAKNELFLREFTENLVPTTCTSTSASRLKSFLASHKELSVGVDHALKSALQRDERCVEIRTFAEQDILTREDKPK